MRIDDPRAAAVFSDPLRRRLVLRLIGQEQSIAALAAATGMELKRVHYHVTALLDLGLLLVTQERARAGRAVKMYRAAAEAFYVPDVLGHNGPQEALAANLADSLAAVRRRTRSGVVYHLDQGSPRMQAVCTRQATHPVIAERWKVLRLSRAQAERLAEDLTRCLKTYTDSQERGARGYLVHIALAPEMPAGGRFPARGRGRRTAS